MALFLVRFNQGHQHFGVRLFILVRMLPACQPVQERTGTLHTGAPK